MSKEGVSIIIPVYNQKERLLITLKHLIKQIDSNTEIIVIDDGSVDGLKEEIKEKKVFNQIEYYYQENRGRAAARNKGIEISSYDNLIFLDADRVVDEDWYFNHKKFLENEKKSVGIGNLRDSFISNLTDFIDQDDIKLSILQLHKKSREYSYYTFVKRGYKNQKCFLNNPWISTFTGNMSIHKDCIEAIKGFDEKFDTWGLENFELGYRLHKHLNISYKLVNDSRTYHLSHGRSSNFYKQNILRSTEYFFQKTKDPIVNKLPDLLLGKITLSDFDNNTVENLNVFYKAPLL